jgi:hypothetical protein
MPGKPMMPPKKGKPMPFKPCAGCKNPKGCAMAGKCMAKK